MDTVELAIGMQDWCDSCDGPSAIVEFHDEEPSKVLPTARYIQVIELSCGHEIIIPVGIAKYFQGEDEF